MNPIFFSNRFNFQEVITFYELFKLLPHCPASGYVIFFFSSLFMFILSISFRYPHYPDYFFPTLILRVIVYNYIVCINWLDALTLVTFARHFETLFTVRTFTDISLFQRKLQIASVKSIMLKYISSYRKNIFITNFTILERFTFVLTATKWSTLLQCTNNALL